MARYNLKYKRTLIPRIWSILWPSTVMILAIIISEYLGSGGRLGHWLTFILLMLFVWVLWSWWKWYGKQRGDLNELEWLDELVYEHSNDIKDHSEQIAWLIPVIEKQNTLPSDMIQRHLNSARRAIGLKETD